MTASRGMSRAHGFGGFYRDARQSSQRPLSYSIADTIWPGGHGVSSCWANEKISYQVRHSMRNKRPSSLGCQHYVDLGQRRTEARTRKLAIVLLSGPESSHQAAAVRGHALLQREIKRSLETVT